ncbi:MAG: peptide-methionine (S)-S-oxide reductase MsrA [Bacillota bacterium]|nr:peptide-methionine (S)-S-oxide reductase MsrA [Bacillota bacterium]
MKPNSCNHRVLSARQSERAAAAVLLLAVLLLAGAVLMPGCQLPDESGQQDGTSEREAAAPAKRDPASSPLVLPDSFPIEEEEAAAIASALDAPLEAYDMLRPGGTADTKILEQAVIDRVVDGDTFMVLRDSGAERLRLIGINTPESYAHHDGNARTHRGESVSRIVRQWLNGRTVYLQFEETQTDRYGRLLAYVWLDAHTMINEVLVREGLAEERKYEPTTQFNDYFASLEKKAQQEKRGIWSDPSGYRENSMNRKVIYLAGGCFWGVERYFQILGKGVLDTETGYANGNVVNPTYQQVCSGTTGFAETVRLTYDADELPLTEIMAHFFRIADPTTGDRQGNDVGSQYRPGVYYEDMEDYDTICEYIDFRRQDYRRPIVVEVLVLQNFYRAEEYHQDYLMKQPHGYCHVNLELAEEALRSEELPDMS